jgi:hypothetical protein
MALGLGSNLIVRDGGVPGVVVRLGKAFAKVELADATRSMRWRGERHPRYPPPRATMALSRAGIPALDPRHGRRVRADERRCLWPRGQGHPDRLRRVLRSGEIVTLSGGGSAITAIAIPSCPIRRDRRIRAVPG